MNCGTVYAPGTLSLVGFKQGPFPAAAFIPSGKKTLFLFRAWLGLTPLPFAGHCAFCESEACGSLTCRVSGLCHVCLGYVHRLGVLLCFVLFCFGFCPYLVKLRAFSCLCAQGSLPAGSGTIWSASDGTLLGCSPCLLFCLSGTLNTLQ